MGALGILATIGIVIFSTLIFVFAILISIARDENKSPSVITKYILLAIIALLIDGVLITSVSLSYHTTYDIPTADIEKVVYSSNDNSIGIYYQWNDIKLPIINDTILSVYDTIRFVKTNSAYNDPKYTIYYSSSIPKEKVLKPNIKEK